MIENTPYPPPEPQQLGFFSPDAETTDKIRQKRV